jgi:hypothetical protein
LISGEQSWQGEPKCAKRTDTEEVAPSLTVAQVMVNWGKLNVEHGAFSG